MDRSDPKQANRQEYGPFTQPIRVIGSIALGNFFRFATKNTDEESDLLYYGYRYYNPSRGVWLQRDPFSEAGGRNSYVNVGNDLLNRWDALGLAPGLRDCVPLGLFSDSGWALLRALPDGTFTKGGNSGQGTSDGAELVYKRLIRTKYNCCVCTVPKTRGQKIRTEEFYFDIDASEESRQISWVNAAFATPFPVTDFIEEAIDEIAENMGGPQPAGDDDKAIIQRLVAANMPAVTYLPPKARKDTGIPTVFCIWGD
jgi:RHS repeat-associated protein